jgi:hypothetical protein
MLKGPAVKKTASVSSVEEKRSSSKTRQSTHWTAGGEAAKRESKPVQWQKEGEDLVKSSEETSPFLLLSQVNNDIKKMIEKRMQGYYTLR